MGYLKHSNYANRAYVDEAKDDIHNLHCHNKLSVILLV